MLNLRIGIGMGTRLVEQFADLFNSFNLCIENIQHNNQGFSYEAKGESVSE